MISLRSIWFAVALVCLLQVQQPLHDALAHGQGVVHCDYCVAAPTGPACAWGAPDVPVIVSVCPQGLVSPGTTVCPAVSPACRGPPAFL
tara:strand:+ start:22412 stop:22678 length:267 start_codon:yes stop_codon:yes gene_type:complete